MGCAVGACLGCVIMGVDGPQRVCREGPVFASDEIAWEGRLVIRSLRIGPGVGVFGTLVIWAGIASSRPSSTRAQRARAFRR